MILLHGIVYALIGIIAGLMAGLLGVGGGLIVVPGLLFVFQQNKIMPESIFMQSAVGTSLAVMIITAQASLRAHYKMGDVLWPVYYKLWPGIMIGTICGALTAPWVPTDWLKIIFAIFLLCLAIKMLTDKAVNQIRQFPKNWINRLVSYFIGFKSGLLGVGGGILIIPYLVYCGIAVRKIAAISNLCTLTAALTGSIIFMYTGYQETLKIPYMTGFVYWPAVLLIALFSSVTAPLGARLNYKLPVQHLKYGFIVLLILTALKMLF